MRLRLTGCVLAACVAFCGAALSARGPASRPATRPASRPATAPARDDPARVRDELAGRVATLVEKFRAERLKDRQGAQAELLALHRAYLDAISRYADDTDAEVRTRAIELLSQAIAQARFQRVLMKLPPPQRKKLIRLKEAHPQVVSGVFSLSWARRLEAVKEIGELEDKEALAEPLLIMCVNHPWQHLAAAAINAAADKKYHSDAMIDALLKVLARTPSDEWHRGWYDSRNPSPTVAAIDALKTIGAKRAAPALLAMMFESRYHDARRSAALADAVAACKEPRAIPLLIEKLDSTSVFSTWSSGASKVTVARSDPPLLALVKLTRQDPAAYRFVTNEFGHSDRRQPIYGFANKKDRDAAIKKFKDWWAKHKDTPPYKGLQPLVLVKPDPAPGAPAPR